MEKDSQRLGDEAAIRDLVAYYSDAVTHLDPVRAASVYSPDGCVAITGHETRGRDAIEAGMRQSFAAFDLLQLIAHGGLITLDGDRAQARWSTIELARRKGATDFGVIFGRYQDELVRLASGWRFARRDFAMAGRMQVPVAKSQFDPAFFTSLLAPPLA